MDRISKKGFTLIEVMVSVMVMAITLTVIMSLFSGGLQSKKRAEDYIRAVDLANSIIQEILLKQTVEPGVQEGGFDNGYSWRVEIISDAPEVPDDKIIIQQGQKVYTINIDIKWKQGDLEKKHTISTLKIE
jgi:general secretion pathway protein I